MDFLVCMYLTEDSPDLLQFHSEKYDLKKYKLWLDVAGLLKVWPKDANKSAVEKVWSCFLAEEAEIDYFPKAESR